jgi:N-acetylmuramoyl-L-alanine amidase
MRQIRWIVVHCTGANAHQTTESIKAYWLHKLGWKSYGYHILIGHDGKIEKLTDYSKPTNGVAGYNKYSIHVCYKGGENGKDTRTPAQKDALLKVVTELKKQFPKANILGHRDFSKDLNNNGIIEPKEFIKFCPSFSARAEFGHIK